MSSVALSLDISHLVSRKLAGEPVDTASEGAILAEKYHGLGMSADLIGEAIGRAAGMARQAMAPASVAAVASADPGAAEAMRTPELPLRLVAAEDFAAVAAPRGDDDAVGETPPVDLDAMFDAAFQADFDAVFPDMDNGAAGGWQSSAGAPTIAPQSLEAPPASQPQRRPKWPVSAVRRVIFGS